MKPILFTEQYNISTKYQICRVTFLVGKGTFYGMMKRRTAGTRNIQPFIIEPLIECVLLFSYT